MVVGAGEKFAGALVVPCFPVLNDWAKTQGIEWSDGEALVKHPKVQDHYEKLVKEVNKHLNQVEQIKKFELLPQPFSLDNGEITPGLGKLRRKVIMEKREDAVRRIYS